ncbi:hypothetical protein [Microvirga massiliensis]|uniref:hypothetical protein n=1 Tax=Microvirga massiliensis TaxID=1033741 RepID=UPI00062B906E|nr:hypothetical protein [Microvirga massiliensis]
MSDELDPLVRDLVEWLANEPRRYREMMEAWRTSCPRLTVWEEALDRDFLERRVVEGQAFVFVTDRGEAFLRASRRAMP